MYRLAILLALLALIVAGCGGDSGDDDGPSSPAPVAQANTDKGGAKKKPASPKESDEEGRDEEEGEASPSSKDATAEGQEGQDEEPDAAGEELQTLIRSAVAGTLARFGLELASLDIEAGGRRLGITVTRDSACNAIAEYEAEMVATIKHDVPEVKSATFRVAGTDQELGYYVLDCEQPKMPDGPGRVVLERTGVHGPTFTRRFTIRGDRWALEYENTANHLAIIVTALGGESKGEYKQPIGSTKRQARRQMYRGAGVYQLQIDGAGQWSVRVKDLGK